MLFSVSCLLSVPRTSLLEQRRTLGARLPALVAGMDDFGNKAGTSGNALDILRV